MATEDDIRRFIAMGHPPEYQLAEWSTRVRELGDAVPAVCLHILEHGDSDQRPAAIYGLRAFGYEAWAKGYWEEEHYEIRRSPDEAWKIIKPKSNPSNPFVEA